eukprot:2043458-Amphidinium_carterae.2
MSDSEESEECEVQGRDQSQPEVTSVQVRAHQRTLQDGRVVNVRSRSRGKGKGRAISMSPVRVEKGKGKGSKKGKTLRSRSDSAASTDDHS